MKKVKHALNPIVVMMLAVGVGLLLPWLLFLVAVLLGFPTDFA